MLNNHTYNLMLQLLQEHKSLWRIKHTYPNDIDGQCADCETVWASLAKDKEKHIEELLAALKRHLAD